MCKKIDETKKKFTMDQTILQACKGVLGCNTMSGHQKKKKDVERDQQSARNQVLLSTLFSWPQSETGQKAATLYNFTFSLLSVRANERRQAAATTSCQRLQPVLSSSRSEMNISARLALRFVLCCSHGVAPAVRTKSG